MSQNTPWNVQAPTFPGQVQLFDPNQFQAEAQPPVLSAAPLQSTDPQMAGASWNQDPAWNGWYENNYWHPQQYDQPEYIQGPTEGLEPGACWQQLPGQNPAWQQGYLDPGQGLGIASTGWQGAQDAAGIPWQQDGQEYYYKEQQPVYYDQNSYFDSAANYSGEGVENPDWTGPDNRPDSRVGKVLDVSPSEPYGQTEDRSDRMESNFLSQNVNQGLNSADGVIPPSFAASNSFAQLPHQSSPFDDIALNDSNDVPCVDGRDILAVPSQKMDSTSHSRQSSFGGENVYFVVGGSEQTSADHSASESPQTFGKTGKKKKVPTATLR